MRLALRLNLLLIGGVAAVAMGFAFYQVTSERRGLERDLQRQAINLAESQAKAVEPLVQMKAYRELQRQMDRFRDRERLVGMAVYDAQGVLVAITSGFASQLTDTPPEVLHDPESEGAEAKFVRLGGAYMHVSAIPLRMGSTSIGTLAIFHDAAYINARVAEAWRRAMVSVTLQTLLIVAVTQLTIRWGLGQPLQRMSQWLRDLRAGEGGAAPKMPEGGEFEPFTHEISRLASSFAPAARKSLRAQVAR